MSLATQPRTIRPHARPVKIRLTHGENGQPAGTVMGPIPLHLAELYIKRGAAVLIDDEQPQTGGRAKRIAEPPRNKSFAGATG